MNRHFKDAWYHLKRAGEESRLGVQETMTPIERELRTRLGLEAAKAEPTRGERLKAEFETLRDRTEKQSERMVGRARSRIEEAQEELRKKRTA